MKLRASQPAGWAPQHTLGAAAGWCAAAIQPVPCVHAEAKKVVMVHCGIAASTLTQTRAPTCAAVDAAAAQQLPAGGWPQWACNSRGKPFCQPLQLQAMNSLALQQFFPGKCCALVPQVQLLHRCTGRAHQAPRAGALSR